MRKNQFDYKKLFHDLEEAILSKGFIFFLLLFSLPIFFRAEVETVYNTFFIQPIFLKINSNFSNDLIFGVLWFWLILLSVRLLKNNYHFTYLWTIIFGYLGFIYVFFRSLEIGYIYDFVFFSFSNNLAYADFILILLLITLIQFFRTDVFLTYKNYKRLFSTKSHFTNFFLEDAPLSDEEEVDEFNWKGHAQLLAKKIKETNVEQSFAIGVSAEWGTGKSSFFFLLRSELKKSLKDKELIYLQFNPWTSKGSSSILEDFFNLFENSLSDFDGDLSREIKSYYRALIKLSNGNFKYIIENSIQAITNNESTGVHYQKVNDSLKSIGKKIVITVDDLDRLDSKEVIEVLRIIRNTSNFYNTFFVLAYDRNYVNEASRSLNSHNFDKYMDKIVQYEMTLPLYDSEIINNYLRKNLLVELKDGENRKSFFSRPHKDQLTGIVKDEEIHFGQPFQNLREVKRFINQFRVEFEKRKDITDPIDLFVIVLIKFKYYNEWRLLSNKENFEKVKNKIARRDGVISLRALILSTVDEVDEENADDDLFGQAPSLDVEGLQNLLSIIFNEMNASNKASLFHLGNHVNYFFDITFGENYSLYELYSDLEEMKDAQTFLKLKSEKLFKIGVNKASEILNQLSLSTYSEEIISKWVAIYLFVIYKKDHWSESELDRVFEKVDEVHSKSDNSTLATNKLIFEPLQVLQANGELKQLYFVSWILSNLIKIQIYQNRNNHYGNKKLVFLEKETLEEEAYKNLKASLDVVTSKADKDIMYTLLGIVYNNVSEIDEDRLTIILNKDACNSFLSFIKLNPKPYIDIIIRPTYTPNNNKDYCLDPFLPQIFQSDSAAYDKEEFDNLLKNLFQEFKDDINYLRVLVFYSYLKAREEIKGINFSEIRGNSIHFKDFKAWESAPLRIYPTQQMKEELASRAEEFIKEVSGNLYFFRFN